MPPPSQSQSNNAKRSQSSGSSWIYFAIACIAAMIFTGLIFIASFGTSLDESFDSAIVRNIKSNLRVYHSSEYSLASKQSSFRQTTDVVDVPTASPTVAPSPIATTAAIATTTAAVSTLPAVIIKTPQVWSFPTPAKCIAPPEIKTTQKMFAMNFTDQRQYLLDLSCLDDPPTSAAADKFIAYAKESFHIGEQKPTMWDVPASVQEGIARSRPGDSNVRYKIAGKLVELPYGWPQETIFVLTASYRDPEAASTIARAFARAAHPERIVIGIHAQSASGDAEPERDPIGGLFKAGVECPAHPVCKYLNNIRVSRAHFDISEGPVISRSIAERHFANETYVLGIDSHCHFARGWDNIVIDMFKRIGNDMALISSYPQSYGPELQGGNGAEDYDPTVFPQKQTAICRTRRVNIHTTVTFKHDINNLDRPLNGPVRVAFFAAGFSFSRGHRILRVPYDYHTPYVFDGEETAMGVRAWTWGYDLYHPDRDVISHLYIASHSPLRPVFWDSPNWDLKWPTQFASQIRIQKQLNTFPKLQGTVKGGRLTTAKEHSRESTLEWSKYQCGPRRSPELYFKWASIYIANNWGPECNRDGSPNSPKGREHCYSPVICGQYKNPGGMPYVPWKEGTEDIFPPMVRSDKYPPNQAEYYHM